VAAESAACRKHLQLKSATPTTATDTNPLANIPFSTLVTFIEGNFSSKITIATVFTLVFSLIENTDLLNLHARQEHPRYHGESRPQVSGWMKALARCLDNSLAERTATLFQKSEDYSRLAVDAKLTSIGIKMDSLAKSLQLFPYDESGDFLGWLSKPSMSDAAPVRLLCPKVAQCQDRGCKSWALHQVVRNRDIPEVTLIEGGQIHSGVMVLTGECQHCKVHCVWWTWMYSITHLYPRDATFQIMTELKTQKMSGPESTSIQHHT
jgi:hypothetical protein